MKKGIQKGGFERL